MKLLEIIQKIFTDLDDESYLVGGFVRNSFLGIRSSDIDIVTASSARECAELFSSKLGGNMFPLDVARAMYRLVLKPNKELGISHIDFTELGGDILQDLRQRDFTVNSLAIPCFQATTLFWNQNLIDPTGGLEDIKQKSIRMTNSDIFKIDPIRILRATRLASQLGFKVEEETKKTMLRDSSNLVNSSAERIRDEFLEILSQTNVEESLNDLSETLVLEALIPELSRGKGVTQPVEHFWDVYDHSLQTASKVEVILNSNYRKHDKIGRDLPWESWLDGYFSEEVSDGHTRSTLLKLAGLLHDIAKPETKTIELDGRVRFLGHPTIGAAKAEAILSRLRLSNRGIVMIRTMVENHLRPSQISQKDELPSDKAIYKYFRDLGDVALDTIYLSLADFLAARGPTLNMAEWQFNSKRISYTIEQGTKFKQMEIEPKLLNGHELSQIFNMKPGRELGKLLEQVKEAQATGKVNSKQEALELVRNLLKGRGETPQVSASNIQND